MKDPSVQQAAHAESARPLTERGLENLVAFARLLGYVRHFHPSDEAAAITDDWHELAVEGVRKAEGAEDDRDLARRLAAHFCPVAPTLRVFPTAKRPPAPAGLSPPANARGLRRVMWHHEGYGSARRGRPYYSTRVYKSPPRGGISTRLPDPRAPYYADLGGGVSCLVPIALWADAGGTLPRPRRGKRETSLEPFTYSGDDRAVRLAAVALAWNVWQHFYPYFDVVKTDWPGVLRETLRAAATDRDAQALLNTMRRMNAQLQDGHASVQMRADWQRYAPPFHLGWIEDRLVVTHVGPEGAGGLRPGDVIVAVDGRPAAEALALQEETVSAATRSRRRWRAIQELLVDTAASEMTLERENPSGQRESVRVRRSVFYSNYWGLGLLEAEPRPAKIAELQPGIWYVDLSRIDDPQYDEILPQLEEARGLIFDLRGYPGQITSDTLEHLIDEPVTSPKNCYPTTLFPDRQRVRWSVRQWDPIAPAAPHLKAKMAFLTDERAISWAETYLAFVEQYRLGEIVGAPTAGTNGAMNELEEVPGGYHLYWTCYRVLKHDGSRHHGVGILPTLPVSRTVRGVVEGRDELLERAIEVVSGKPSGRKRREE
jgi:C-terminal processing protease CtpA/Prc